MIKLAVPLILIAYLFSQKTELDSTKSELVLIEDNSEKVYQLEHDYIKSNSYELSLFEFHRPNYLIINALAPKYQSFTRDFIDISDHFSDLTDYKTMNHTWLDTVQYSPLQHSYTTIIPENSNPFTKLYLVDGDFLYANVDITFFQRLNENFALYLGGNTRESIARGSGRLDHTQIRTKADYFLNKKSRFSISYYLMKRTYSDYGYVENDEILISSELDDYNFTKRDDREQISLNYHSKNWTVFSHYSGQFKAVNISDSLDQLAQISDMSVLGFQYKKNKNTYRASAENNIITLRNQNEQFRETRLAISYAYKDSIKQLNLSSFTLLDGRKRIVNSKFPYKLEGKYRFASSQINFAIEEKLPSINEAHLKIEATKSGINLYQPYFWGIKENKAGLKPEKMYLMNYNYQISKNHQVKLSANLVENPIFYNLNDSLISNFENSHVMRLSYLGEESLFESFKLYLNAHSAFNKKLSFESNFRASLGFKSNFTIFKNMHVNIDLSGNYISERPSIYFINYADVYAIDEKKKLDYAFYTSLEASFRLRNALFRLSITNALKEEYQVVRGYESKARGVLFGVEWKFYD